MFECSRKHIGLTVITLFLDFYINPTTSIYYFRTLSKDCGTLAQMVYSTCGANLRARLSSLLELISEDLAVFLNMIFLFRVSTNELKIPLTRPANPQLFHPIASVPVERFTDPLRKLILFKPKE